VNSEIMSRDERERFEMVIQKILEIKYIRVKLVNCTTGRKSQNPETVGSSLIRRLARLRGGM
jgi:hypothetical protein